MTPEVGSKGIREALDVICFINEAYFAEFKKAYFDYKSELLCRKRESARELRQGAIRPDNPISGQGRRRSEHCAGVFGCGCNIRCLFDLRADRWTHALAATSGCH